MVEDSKPGNPSAETQTSLHLLNMESCIQKRNCADCGHEFVAYDILWDARPVIQQQRCEQCVGAIERAKHAAEKTERIKKQKLAFHAACPPLYRDTEPARLHPKFRESVQHWQYGPRGLGLVGIAGIGKTRAAYWLLKRMVALDQSVLATNATTFAKLCIDQFSDDKESKWAAVRTLEAIRRIDLWLLDDLGKQRMTERGEVELHAILEHRTAYKRPIIWTSNSTSEVLRAKFSEERTEPIMRRLTDFTDIISV
ncbi:MAG: hypothetical protein C5B47_07985 [Verrucomicrobia bacterium]|nr:MAG: hypothetical protein C5B47_07985 [Verrucomicrobiota bacterium]